VQCSAENRTTFFSIVVRDIESASAMSDNSEPRKVIYVAILANLGIAVSKFAAAAFSGSSAMAAEGIHSVVDTGNELLLLLGNRRASRPPDLRHPFGYGKALYFWALIVAVSMFVLGGGVSVCKGIYDLLHPPRMENVAWSYAVLAAAATFELISWYISRRALKKHGPRGRTMWQRVRASRDPSVFSVFVEDSAALAGIAIAFLGVALGHWLRNPYLDPIASILIGVVMIGAAAVLARETGALLVGEGLERSQLRELTRVIADDPAIRHVHDILTMQLGPQEVLLVANVQFDTALSVDELYAAAKRLHTRVRVEQPSIGRMCFQLQRTARPVAR
jgi:cation diffusion facilitator family transporter